MMYDDDSEVMESEIKPSLKVNRKSDKAIERMNRTCQVWPLTSYCYKHGVPSMEVSVSVKVQ